MLPQLPDGLLADRLRRAGFGAADLAAQTGVASTLHGSLAAPLVRAALTQRGDLPALLTLLLTYGGRVESAALAEVGDALVAARLARHEGDLLRSGFRTTMFDGSIVVADDPSAGPDAVMGPSGTTESLVALLDADAGSLSGRAVLDVGAGAGSLALAAALRGAATTAVDVNPRATQLTAFNAALNGVTVEALTGDLLAPVQGRTFDLVLAQPPYVPAVPGEPVVTFMHGGPRGDELATRLLGGLAGALEPGGMALVRTDVALPLDDRVESAVASALDLAVIATPGVDARAYAAAHASVLHPALAEGYARVAGASAAAMRDQGIEHLAQAIVIVRRPCDATRRPWRVRLPVRVLPRGGQDLRRYVGALDLSTAGDAALARARVRAQPAAVLRSERPLDGGAPSSSMHLADGAFGADSEISAAGEALFELLDTPRQVSDLTAHLVQETGSTPDRARTTIHAFVRDGLARGLLVAA